MQDTLENLQIVLNPYDLFNGNNNNNNNNKFSKQTSGTLLPLTENT